MKDRSLAAVDELSALEAELLLELATELKREKAASREHARLAGKHLALVLEQPLAPAPGVFELAASDQGARVTVIDPGELGAGGPDEARVLGRLYDAIELGERAPRQVLELARRAGVPVYNGLARAAHPAQWLADCLTMREHCPRPLPEVRLAYVGDTRTAMFAALLQGSALLGLDFRQAAPRALWPGQPAVEAARRKAGTSGARLLFTESPAEAVHQADFIYTDGWVAPPTEIAPLLPYRVSSDLLLASGNRAVGVLHGQPLLARHGPELSAEVLGSPACLVREQAENRLHTIKALLVATLA